MGLTGAGWGRVGWSVGKWHPLLLILRCVACLAVMICHGAPSIAYRMKALRMDLIQCKRSVVRKVKTDYQQESVITAGCIHTISHYHTKLF